MNQIDFRLPNEAARHPVVILKGDEALADSRDVASFFGKNHFDVLRTIRNLIASEPSLGQRNFASFKINDLTGESTSHYEMNRDDFTILAMGFTGTKALKWKLAYIDAFNTMESRLKETVASINVRDPAQLTKIAMQLIDLNRDLEGRVAEMMPQVQALERIALSDGSLCITDAAKTLQIQPKVLFAFLRSHHWIYSRAGSASEVAYQDKLAYGFLEHKTTTVTRSDGSEKTVTQARVTPKGLTRLAKELQPVASVV